MNKYKTITALAVATGLLFGCSNDEEKNSTDKVSKTNEGHVLSDKALQKITDEYRSYAINEIDHFVDKTKGFTDAVITGDVEKAKELYAPARMHYERSEPIAEVFADLDPKIDAREGDVSEKEWGGYHRIEDGLWTHNTTKGYEEYAQQLMKDTNVLRAKVETVEVTPDLLVTGAVDLLNEVSTSKITGEEDRYSHTDLYDFVANVQGAEKIFELFQPHLEKHDADLAKEINQRFETLNTLLDQYKKGEDYVSYTDLDEKEVKELSEAVNELAEPLSQIGTILGE